MWKPSKAKTRNFSDLRLCEMVCACHWGLIGAHSPRAMFSGLVDVHAFLTTITLKKNVSNQKIVERALLSSS